MAGKRDSGYYRERLRREFPAIYKDLISGRIASVRQGAIKAGLIRPPSRLDALKREWKSANLAERKAFLEWARKTLLRGGSAPVVSIDDGAGRLRTPVVDFMQAWLRVRKKRAGHIMGLMGFRNFDYRLAQALKGKPLPREVLDPLAKWLRSQGFG